MHIHTSTKKINNSAKNNEFQTSIVGTYFWD